MQDQQLNDLLHSYSQQLEQSKLPNLQSWVLSLQNYSWQQKQKADKKMGRLTLQKKVIIIIGLLYAIGLLFLAVNSVHWPTLFFCISTAAIGTINLVAVVGYIRQLNWITAFQHEENIVLAQEKLVKLRHSSIYVTRILFLQAPFYTTFSLNPAMINSHTSAFFFIALPVIILFSAASFWLYKNIRLENADKKWFRILFAGNEWGSIIQSQKFLEDIEEFKTDIVTSKQTKPCNV